METMTTTNTQRPTIIRRAVHRAAEGIRVSRNGLMKYLGRSDNKRWSSADGLEDWWVARTEIIAQFVPENSRLIEFGAGKRQLEARLPSGCSYTPSDLVDRGAGTIVCDLNQRPLPDLQNRHFQVAVFGGVLEYIRDVGALAQWLSDLGIQTCILSFDAFPEGLNKIDHYRELKRRMYYGYMNNLTERDLFRAFTDAGYVCDKRGEWTTQIIVRFSKS